MLTTRAAAKQGGKPAWLKWYATQRWRKLAKAQTDAEPLCRLCRARGRITKATIADHVEHHRGDPDAFWNGALQSLCHPCHSAKSRADEVERRTGRRQTVRVRGCNQRGEPLDPSHPWHSS